MRAIFMKDHQPWVPGADKILCVPLLGEFFKQRVVSCEVLCAIIDMERRVVNAS